MHSLMWVKWKKFPFDLLLSTNCFKNVPTEKKNQSFWSVFINNWKKCFHVKVAGMLGIWRIEGHKSFLGPLISCLRLLMMSALGFTASRVDPLCAFLPVWPSDSPLVWRCDICQLYREVPAKQTCLETMKSESSSDSDSGVQSEKRESDKPCQSPCAGFGHPGHTANYEAKILEMSERFP